MKLRRQIPKARRIPRPPGKRIDVTRGEYNVIIDILNERNIIRNRLREAVERLEQAGAVQFTRIAQIQADVDRLKRAIQK